VLPGLNTESRQPGRGAHLRMGYAAQPLAQRQTRPLPLSVGGGGLFRSAGLIFDTLLGRRRRLRFYRAKKALVPKRGRLAPAARRIRPQEQMAFACCRQIRHNLE